MGLYKNTNGVLTPIAGRGKAEYGASTVRTGTFTNSSVISEHSAIEQSVSFAEPMPDANYDIEFSVGQNKALFVQVTRKTAAGFSAFIARPLDGNVAANEGSITYTAFKLYTDNEYNELLNSKVKVLKIPVASKTIAPNDYDAIVSSIDIPSDSIIVGVMTELGNNIIVTPQKTAAGVFRVMGANPSPSISYTYAGYVYVSYI